MAKTALQTLAGQTVVFIKTDAGFRPQPVVIGQTDETWAEIQTGLVGGQRYVSLGAFTLKAELSRDQFGDEHD